MVPNHYFWWTNLNVPDLIEVQTENVSVCKSITLKKVY